MCQLLIFPHFPSEGNLNTIFITILFTIFIKTLFLWIGPQGSQLDGKESTEWSAMQGWRKYATELVWGREGGGEGERGGEHVWWTSKMFWILTTQESRLEWGGEGSVHFLYLCVIQDTSIESGNTRRNGKRDPSGLRKVERKWPYCYQPREGKIKMTGITESNHWQNQ